MKTAMQELIDDLQKEVDSFPEDCVKNIIPRQVLNGMHHSNCNALAIAKKALEKEKEQMFYWFYGGGGLSITDDFREEFENNYNQTYNQNK